MAELRERIKVFVNFLVGFTILTIFLSIAGYNAGVSIDGELYTGLAGLVLALGALWIALFTVGWLVFVGLIIFLTVWGFKSFG